jgi:predicted PurR-regulated permease PerM
VTLLRRRALLLAGFVAGLVLALYVFSDILVPFLLATVIAYVLSPLIGTMTRIGWGRRRMPRWVAVLVFYSALLAGLGLFSVHFLPRLADEVGTMMREIPASFRYVREEWLPAAAETYEQNFSDILETSRPDAVSGAEPRVRDADDRRAAGVVLRPERDGGYRLDLRDLEFEVQRSSGDTLVLRARARTDDRDRRGVDLEQSFGNALRDLLERGQEHATVLLTVGQDVAVFLIGFTFTFFLTLMLSAFILIDQKRILDFIESLFPPEWRPDFRLVLERIDRGLAGVVRGQILICLINGVLSGIGFALLDLRYWPVLTAIATVFTLIPVFGMIVSSIPAVLLGLLDSWTTGLLTVGWISIIHILEAYVLDPKIIGTTARIHPVVVFFALLAGERLGGLLGVLLAVPVASIIQNVFLYWRSRAYAEESAAATATAAAGAGSTGDGSSAKGDPEDQEKQ